MWPSFIVSTAPLFNDYSRFGQTSKDFCIQTFFAKGAIETFIAAILPRLSRFDVRQLDAVAFHLLLQRPCEQFAAVVELRIAFGVPKRVIISLSAALTC